MGPSVPAAVIPETVTVLPVPADFVANAALIDGALKVTTSGLMTPENAARVVETLAVVLPS